MLEHLHGVIHGAVARGLRPHKAAAVAHALAGEDAVGKAAGAAAPLAEEVADLPAAHADIPGGNVHIGPDVFIQLRHEALAKPHDLGIALALGIEVAAALGAAHGESGEGVLQHLLKAQELHHAFVHRGVEAQAALVGAQDAVELHAPAPVHMGHALIVGPGDAEFHHPVRVHHPFQNGVLLILGMLVDHRLQGGEHLFHGLNEFRHRRAAFLDLVDDSFNISVHVVTPF